MTIMGGSASDAAAALLIEHQHLDSGACRCGWGAIADASWMDHAQHVLHQLQLAGLDVVWR